MPSITGTAAPGSDLVALQQAAPRLPTSRFADPGRGQVDVTHRTAVVELDGFLALTTGRAHPGPAGTRLPREGPRAGRRVGHRELGQRLVDGGCRRPGPVLAFWPSSEICRGRLRRSTMFAALGTRSPGSRVRGRHAR